MRALAAVGTDLLRLKRGDEAVPLLERAVEKAADPALLPDARAAAQFGLAQALWQRNRAANRERMRELVQAAQAAYAETGPKHEAERTEITSWLVNQRLTL